MTLELNLQKGLVGHWTMNNEDSDNGFIRDKSANDNHASINGATSASGLFGGAYNFDSDDIVAPVSIPQDDTSEDRTVSLWFNSDDVSKNNQGLIGQDSGGFDFFIQLSRDSTGELMIATGSDTKILPPGTIDTGEWHHISVILEGSNILYSYDGGSITDTGLNRSNYQAAFESQLAIGSISFDSGEDFNGRIQDVRVYERALPQTQLTALYNMRSQRNASI